MVESPVNLTGKNRRSFATAGARNSGGRRCVLAVLLLHYPMVLGFSPVSMVVGFSLNLRTQNFHMSVWVSKS